jgi:hypothetical protein
MRVDRPWADCNMTRLDYLFRGDYSGPERERFDEAAGQGR